MSPSPHQLLLGPDSFSRNLAVLFAAVVFLGTFAAYALDVFAVAGGVVFLAGEAALVGVVAGLLLGFQRGGAAFAWLVAYAALLGQSADHYFLGISHRPIADRAAAFLQPDGLASLAVLALVLGTMAWTVGVLGRWTIETVRQFGADVEA